MTIVRFAPSPTGWLHVGNARVAVVNFLYARRAGGRFLLRLDDTDRGRSRPEYAEGITRDLGWLGLTWDGFFRQSDRMAAYAAAAERLKAAGRLYPAYESAEELDAKRKAALRRGRAPVYDRAALEPGAAARGAASGRAPHWRFRLSVGTAAWQDLVLGSRRIGLGTLSDPVLIRADGTPLYSFTSVVDDLAEGVSAVIRGEDHVTNTAVQRDLWAALGGEPGAVAFGHLPLLRDPAGTKLSKRVGALSLRALRREGFEAGAVAAYLARLGSGRDAEPLALADLVQDFDLANYSGGAPCFDPDQLLALNRRTLHGLEFAAVAARLPAGADERFWRLVRGNLDRLPEARAWWAVVAGEIAPPAAEPERGFGVETEFLALAAGLLPPEPWDEATPALWLAGVREASGRKGRALFAPLRLALTGVEHGPELAPLIGLMGRALVLRRLTPAPAG